MEHARRTPVREAFDAWRDWLPTDDISKLCLYANSGSAIMEKYAKKINGTFVNTEFVHGGEGQHYVQEDCPHEIGEALAKWYGSTVTKPITNCTTT